MAKLSKDQWITEGLLVLKETGATGLSIVKLSQRLNVTRGAFYHHFNSINDLIDEMIAVWEEQIVTQGFAKSLTNSSNPKQEITNLIDYATALTDSLDLVFRKWASSNDHVKKHMERLDQSRLAILEKLFQRLARDKKKGSILARIAFYGYIGTLHTYPVPNAKLQKESALEVLEMIMHYLSVTEAEEK